MANRQSDDTTLLTRDRGAGPWRVLVVVGDGRVRRVELPTRGAVVIGRDAACEVVLDDAAVSKRHARLALDDAGATLLDLGSKNGTCVDGKRIVEPTLLEIGKVFEIGAATLVLKHVYEEARPVEDAAEQPVIADPAMKAVVALVDQVAPSDLPVLVQGETGSGKEVIASLVHARSRRHAGALVRINCAALPVALLEAELFGNEAGAFTGATGKRRGLIEEANDGTLFLDEVGELPLDAQAKVLRALEDGAFFRVGGRKAVRVNVRFIAATNRELERAVREGRFRADLYYRLNGITLHVPPLRSRPAEIVPLAERFVRRAARDAGFGKTPTLSKSAEARLVSYTWPGNVRELKNVMQRAVLLAAGETIRDAHLLLGQADIPPSSVPLPATMAPLAPSSARAATGGDAPRDLRSDLDERERARIEEALRACAGNQTRAAALLGISRRTLISRLEKYGFDRPLKK
ncbi:MAG: sigma 54-interacting transcriptional regulator [Polyangiaceae bacterium]|nr:sigma 54-interacting transcriptional regulator [Polyangiaceae bacterium]